MQKVINLGKTIQIKGELTGSEDLTIEGKLEGKILLRGHNLTIGENGDIRADIQAKAVVVAGKLVGNTTAEDRVEVAMGGAVNGNISAPRVVLADGCQFQGSVDMDSGSRTKTDSAASTTGADRRPATAGRVDQRAGIKAPRATP